MIQQIPLWLDLGFIFTTLLTFYFIMKALHFSRQALIISFVLLLVQGIAGAYGFYTVTDTIPPRFPLLILPGLLVIIFVFFSKRGKLIMNKASLPDLTLLHIVRIPVEIVLWGLFLHEQIPQIMTFEGANFDILSGISAPIIWWYAFKDTKVKKQVLLFWNVLCLILLLIIVVMAVLASPVPFQQLGFDQPNVAVQYFPYVWLPAYVVPVVLFSHLASIRLLIQRSK
jgi:hypothetical protein